MSPEYPYQLASFLDNEPMIGEGVYQGKNGWYPQIALKRRFKIVDMDEDGLLAALADFASAHTKLKLQTGQLIKLDRIPVQIIEVLNSEDVKQFHLDFVGHMSTNMESRYPERDGLNYLPHITAEFNGKMVIDDKKFANKAFEINRIFLLKDVDDENSIAYRSFEL